MRAQTKFGVYLLAIVVTLSLAMQGVQSVQASPVSTNDPAATWYVSKMGNDANDCAAPATPCLTINAAVGKGADGDVIKITEGAFENENVFINKSVAISAGWDLTFSSRVGTSIIEGRTVKVDDYDDNEIKSVTIDHMIIRNSTDYSQSSALYNNENLLITNCEIYDNSSKSGVINHGALTMDTCKIHNNEWGGLQSSGTVMNVLNSHVYDNSVGVSFDNGGTGTIENSLIYDNQGTQKGGGGIKVFSDITLTVNNSSIYQNTAIEENGGGIAMAGYWSTVSINNSTISRNEAQEGGGLSGGNSYSNLLTLSNVTLIENRADTGGGISGWARLYNTIVAHNTAKLGDNCAPLSTVEAVENNILFNADCGFMVPPGGDSDYLDVDPQIVSFIPEVGFAPLSPDSPAINAGDTPSCVSSTDQRGMARVGICDIGSYEYTTPGAPSTLHAISGSGQRVPPNTVFIKPFRAVLLDVNGSPVDAGYEVTFSAPSVGASGVFAGSGLSTETVQTAPNGYATSSLLTANAETGDYPITAGAAGVVNQDEFEVGNGVWLVSTTGSDLNNCLTLSTTCRSLQGVLAKPNFFDGDIILVEAGKYIPGEIFQGEVKISGNAVIRGGWNSNFTSQIGVSNIPQTLVVTELGNASVEKMAMEGIPYSAYVGGVINNGTLVIKDSLVINGHGIINTGDLTILSTTISGNTAYYTRGGGLANSGMGAKVVIINSTISSNTASQAGAISNDMNHSPTIEIYNSTITNNAATDWGSGGIEGWYGITIANSIIVGNISPPQSASAFSPDCRGTFTSLGHNIVGNVGINNAGYYPCSTTFVESDQWGDNTTPIPAEDVLLPLVDVGNGIWMHPISSSSLARDAGNPLPPGTPGVYACPLTDQRGVIRPQGEHCDIGAYEYNGTFFDVPPDNWAWKYIEAIYNAGITGGCGNNPLRYCPDTKVTRTEMAIFLERGMNGPSFVPPDAVGGVFHDIPTGHWAAKWIEQLATDSITGGCGNGNYCPNGLVTREQMAVFLLRAKYGPTYNPPAVGDSTGFNDVPVNYWAATWIKQLAAEGITSGCGGGNFCPLQSVTRAQMAVFLQVTFGLPLP